MKNTSALLIVGLATAGWSVMAAEKNWSSPVQVYTYGGDALKIFFSKRGLIFHKVYLEGPIQKSFEGRVEYAAEKG